MKSFSPPPGGRDRHKRGPGPRRGPPPSPALLTELLRSHGVSTNPTLIDRVWTYHQYLRAHNQDLDLTRLIGFQTMVQRHYADCLILEKWMKGKWPSPLVDIGSGAGFPGLMIKIANPHLPIILAEPRPRRVAFLQGAIQKLGLKDITVFGHKFTSRSFHLPVQGAITRAFETVDKTMPRLMFAIPLGGHALFMKGPKGEEEAANFKHPDWRLARKITYRIQGTTLDRILLDYERVALTSASPEKSRDWEEDEVEGTGEAED